MITNSQKVLGIILAAIAIFFWGITFVCTKYLLNDFSSLEILFYRFISAYLGLWLIHPKFEKIAMMPCIRYLGDYIIENNHDKAGKARRCDLQCCEAVVWKVGSFVGRRR